LSEENKNNQPDPTLANVANAWRQEAQDVTLNNMRVLSNRDAFKIGEKEYTRKLLKPKELVQLNKIEKTIGETPDLDDEKYMEYLFQQAQLCLKDFTQEDFDNCDVVMLQSVVSACQLATKGFRRIQ